MLSHLARFSIFLLVVMVGFAITFNSLFAICEGAVVNDGFETFRSSLGVMFQSMLGGPKWEMFANSQSICPGPEWALSFGFLLLAMYMLIVVILLLNLLIAVLSTVQAKVSERY